ncbi:MAG: 50S ribosomal protein L33 [Chloroflexi bacterium CFX4]|nr:50S ribosomal protein L33 [Chloroflexi bacterium CFX4]MDL1924469.1 50S ribosomal protein L33 [Chloroflexi bacterium CFX3]
MAKKDVRIVIKLVSTESGHVYYSQKSKRNDPQRLELRKYDPILRRHALYRESR